MSGWAQKKVIFADVHYCIYSEIVGGGQKSANVIYGWSLASGVTFWNSGCNIHGQFYVWTWPSLADF